MFPGKPGFAARAMRDQADVDDVIELMHVKYERIVAREKTSTSGQIRA